MTPEQAIAQLISIFGEPNTPNPSAFVVAYTKALSGADPKVLDGAITRVIGKSKFWPKPAEVLAEAETVAADLYRERTPHFQSDFKPEPSPEAKARVSATLQRLKEKIQGDSVHFGGSEPDWRTGQRDRFDRFQTESSNDHLHRQRQLTPMSKRIVGERE